MCAHPAHSTRRPRALAAGCGILGTWAGHDKAGSLPPHWDSGTGIARFRVYDRVTGQRVFHHILGEQSPVIDGVCH